MNFGLIDDDGGGDLLVITHHDNLLGQELEKRRLKAGLRCLVDDDDIEESWRDLELCSNSMQGDDPYGYCVSATLQCLSDLSLGASSVLSSALAQTLHKLRVAHKVSNLAGPKASY